MTTPPSPPAGPGHSWPPPSPQHPWAPPPGYGQAPPALNGFALASLLVGLLCFPPLGVVFGIVALVQIPNKRQRGKALAIAGLAVSVVMTGVLVLTAGRVATALGERFDRIGELTEAEGELTDMEDLLRGDCFNVPGADMRDNRPLIYKIDCAEPHHGEVTLSEAVGLEGAPGSEEADRHTEDVCWKAQDAYAMDTWALPATAQMFYFAPSRETWRQGDRQLLCVIATTDEEQRGSLRRGEAELTPGQVEFLKAANAVEFLVGRSPEEDVEDALPEHRAWALKVHGALGDEAKVLEAHKGRPGMDAAARATLKEIEAARKLWVKASQARTAAEFDKQGDLAMGAMSVETEKSLRGAYGLATTVPEWLEEWQGGPGGPGGGPGRAPSTESV
ncbi:DUF4190 domain-containing protein [Streptomyces sp. ISL-94]|uniref:DUF4190 domain-containing protein n=1 Tax=Streptomyces sp. ISL-94 TaxID=2819190 RepID=UPI001BEC8183|nr:DUF4190 domain-containing protein [Streptomyces sp. ISL-94]MBT2481293.1 septum formation family protein [Streptomyces sp. ISL-94]